MVGSAGHDDASAAGITEDLGIGRVGVGALLPLVGVELLQERLHPLHIAGRAHLEGAGLAAEVGAARGFQIGDDLRNAVEVGNATRGDDAARAGFGDELGVGRTIGRAARGLVFVKLLDDGQQALGLGRLADVEDPIGAGLGQFGGQRGDDLSDGGGLIGGAEHHQAVTGGVGVERGRLGGAALILLSVDLVDHRQQVGGAAALRLNRVQLALGLVGSGIQRRDDGLHLRHEGIGGQHDQATAVGFGRDAHQVGHGPPRVLGHEHPGGHLRQRVGFADHFHHLEIPTLGGAPGAPRPLADFIVEALDDALGVLEILTRARDHDGVGFAVEGNRSPTDGLVAGIEFHHGVGDDTHHLRGIGVVQAKHPRAAGRFRGLIEAFHDLRDQGDLLPGGRNDHPVGRRVGHDAALRGVLGSPLALEQVGGQGGGQGGQSRGIGLLELDDLHLARLHV